MSDFSHLSLILNTQKLKAPTVSPPPDDFTGQIPTTLGRLKKLEELQLNSNDLSGEMPEGVCSLAETQVLITAVADCDPTSPFGSVACNVPDCCSACT